MQITLKELLSKIDYADFIGQDDTVFSEIVALGHGQINEQSLFWCSDKNKEALLELEKGSVLISSLSYDFIKKSVSKNLNCIVVNNPRLAFMKVLNLFFVEKVKFGIISKSSDIDLSVKYNKEKINIGSNVVIEEGVVLGDNVIIGHNTVVKQGTKIGDNVKIGSNNTIGGVGFGYEINSKGFYDLLPHIGNVIIKANVEIGNNTCIDRAVLGSTIIGENVKIDNLVHIAHGVKVGRNSLIIANSMVAGSVDIGENVWVSPSSSIMQKLKIEDDSLVGMGSVVIKDVEKSTIVAGVPAKKIKNK